MPGGAEWSRASSEGSSVTSLLIVALQLSSQKRTEAAAGRKLLNAVNEPFPVHPASRVICTESLW